MVGLKKLLGSEALAGAGRPSHQRQGEGRCRGGELSTSRPPSRALRTRGTLTQQESGAGLGGRLAAGPGPGLDSGKPEIQPWRERPACGGTGSWA